MARGERSKAPCETLSGAAEMVMAMDAEQFQHFKPRTVAEQTAVLLAQKVMRGDCAAFNQLQDIAETGEQSFGWVEDVLVKIRECAFEYCDNEQGKGTNGE